MNLFSKLTLAAILFSTCPLFCQEKYLDDVIYDKDLKSTKIQIEEKPIGTYFVQNKPKHKIYIYWITKNGKKYKGISAGTFKGEKLEAFAPLFCAEEHDFLPTTSLFASVVEYLEKDKPFGGGGLKIKEPYHVHIKTTDKQDKGKFVQTWTFSNEEEVEIKSIAFIPFEKDKFMFFVAPGGQTKLDDMFYKYKKESKKKETP